MPKLTLEEVIQRIAVHDDKALARTETDRQTYIAIIDGILAEAGWTVDEYEEELVERMRSRSIAQEPCTP